MKDQLLSTPPSEQRQAFLSLQTPRNLAGLLDYRYSALVYQIYKVPDDRKYELFTIPKKSGEVRTITAPNPTLKFIQRRLASVLQNVYVTKPIVYGFVEGKNIVDNARKHKKKTGFSTSIWKIFFHQLILDEYAGCLWGSLIDCLTL